MNIGLKQITTANGFELSPKHENALITFYQTCCVEDTLEDMLAFWDASGWVFHGDIPPLERLAFHEESWLCDTFPKDFTFV